MVRLPSAVRRALQEKTTRDERERAIQSLRESEERVRLLLDSTAEAIYGIDVQGNCTFCNAASYACSGMTIPTICLGNKCTGSCTIREPTARGTRLKNAKSTWRFREGKGSHADNEVLWRKDGSSFPAEYWSYPVVRNGKPIGSVVTFLDITERKRAEEALGEAKQGFGAWWNPTLLGFRSGSQWKAHRCKRCLFGPLGIYERKIFSRSQLRWDTMTPPEYHDTDQRAVEQLRNTGMAPPWEKEFVRKDGRRVAVLIGVVTLLAEPGETRSDLICR